MRKGFTIIEVIITIAVIAVIGLISFIGFSNVTKETKEKQYQSIIKDITTAAEVYLENKKDLKEELYSESKLAQYIELSALQELNLIENNIKDPRTNKLLNGSSLVKIYLLEDKTIYYEYPGEVDDIVRIVGISPVYVNKGAAFDCFEEMSGVTKSGKNISLSSRNATCTNIDTSTSGTKHVNYNIVGNYYEENNPTYTRTVIVVELTLGDFTTTESTLGNTYYIKLTRSITIESPIGLESVQYCTTTSTSCTPTTNYNITSEVTSQIVSVTFGTNASAQRLCIKTIDKLGNTETKCDIETFKVDTTAPTGVSISVGSSANIMNIKATDSESGIWKYICQYSTSSTFSSYSSVTVTTTSTSTTCNLGSLSYNTTYYVRVVGYNNAGLTTTSGTVTTKALNPNDIISINSVSTTTVFRGSSFNCYTNMSGKTRGGSTVALTSTNTTCSTLDTSTAGTKTVTYTIKAGYYTGTAPTYNRTVSVIDQSKDFAYTGGEQTYTVPVSGTYELSAYGAQGGGTSGGKGGYVKGRIYLNAGDVLTIRAGGQNGYNGGGSGYNSGGGASTIIRSGVTLLTAAGGGGASPSTSGGSGGSGTAAGGTGGSNSTKTAKVGDITYTYTTGSANPGVAGTNGGGGGSGFTFNYTGSYTESVCTHWYWCDLIPCLCDGGPKVGKYPCYICDRRENRTVVEEFTANGTSGNGGSNSYSGLSSVSSSAGLRSGNGTVNITFIS